MQPFRSPTTGPCDSQKSDSAISPCIVVLNLLVTVLFYLIGSTFSACAIHSYYSEPSQAVRGRLLDSKSNRPVADVRIKATENSTIRSASDGTFYIPARLSSKHYFLMFGPYREYPWTGSYHSPSLDFFHSKYQSSHIQVRRNTDNKADQVLDP